ncbi:MAG: hypothetical protein AB7F75_11320 [Planctomycetota bacterium]
MTDRAFMKPFFAMVALVGLPMVALQANSGELTEASEAPRSPEGSHDLDKLHKVLISALMDEKIERRFLALNKVRQLAHDELSRDLVSAVVESLDGDNHNYLWFAAHTLKRISGKDLGISREAWRDWLRKEYVAPGSQPKPAPEASKVDSGSVGHDNSGGTPALDVPPSDKLGHDPNIKVVEEKPEADDMKPKAGNEEKVPEFVPTMKPGDKGADSKP